MAAHGAKLGGRLAFYWASIQWRGIPGLNMATGPAKIASIDGEARVTMPEFQAEGRRWPQPVNPVSVVAGITDGPGPEGDHWARRWGWPVTLHQAAQARWRWTSALIRHPQPNVWRAVIDCVRCVHIKIHWIGDGETILGSGPLPGTSLLEWEDDLSPMGVPYRHDGRCDKIGMAGSTEPVAPGDGGVGGDLLSSRDGRRYRWRWVSWNNVTTADVMWTSPAPPSWCRRWIRVGGPWWPSGGPGGGRGRGEEPDIGQRPDFANEK